MLKDNFKQFLLDFFKESKIEEEDGVLTISKVKEDFEEFIGKKAPYKFVFDIELHNKIKNSELIMQGNYFLLAIRDYLRDKGQTSLSKINIRVDLDKLKNNILTKKYKVISIKEKDYNFLYEFSFLSTYQYLNDKKQSTSVILISDNERLDLDLSNFKTNKGNLEELPQLSIQNEYLVAKDILNKKIVLEARPIKSLLKEKLKKELFRIKDHYGKQINEKDEEVENCEDKINMLKGKLRHTSYWRDIATIKRMIKESSERLELLKKRTYKSRLKDEEKFHINDEIEKHALSIKNNLINVTLYYYPLFELLVKLKGKNKTILFDPIKNKIL